MTAILPLAAVWALLNLLFMATASLVGLRRWWVARQRVRRRLAEVGR